MANAQFKVAFSTLDGGLFIVGNAAFKRFLLRTLAEGAPGESAKMRKVREALIYQLQEPAHAPVEVDMRMDFAADEGSGD